MKKRFLINRILLWVGMLFVSFQAFAQTPYNIVVNIHKDPETQMAFNWFTGVGITGGEVRVMLNGNTITVPATYTPHTNYTENKVVVTGLSPNTTYTFQVGKTNAWSSIGTFKTAKTNKDPFTFIYTTDPQAITPAQFDIAKITAYAAFAKFPESKFWLACGDLVNKGSQQGQWDTLFLTQQSLFLKTPFAPVQGNHDGSTNFRRHFNTESFGTDPYGSTYTFIYGDAQFFAISSERWDDPITLNAAYINDVKDWMRKQVNDNPNVKWRIVYFHRNIYTGGLWQNDPDGDIRPWRDAMAPLFDELNIDVAFQGHDHIYEVIGPVYDRKLVQGSVSNVTTVQKDTITKTNVTGKSGGTFNVTKGTLYFLNGASGYLQLGHDINLLTNMPDSASCGIPNYPSLFTGRLGNNGKPDYSHVSVSTDSIVITTYEIVNGSSVLLDKIKVVKPCEPYCHCLPNTHGTLTYTTTQSFANVEYVIKDELRIKNNATVTFTNSTVRFYEGAKVIVEPGSKLVISGGIFTAACFGKMWEGIVVLGNPTQPQEEQYQGSVEVRNSAVIEHALCGISAAPTSSGNAGGGIISAYNATFRNNKQAIEYGPYENKYPNGSIWDNIGKFSRCTFIVDKDKHFSFLNYHVSLWEVRGVTFEGCTFDKNTQSGVGIYTMDAGFKVVNYCYPGQSGPGVDCACPASFTNIATTFKHLGYGIHSSSTGNPRSIYIDQSAFESLDNGLRISNHDNYRLTRCTLSGILSRGLWSENSSGYRIEENEFFTSNHASACGIYMCNSGGAENRIYKNDFTNFNKGIFVELVNANTSRGTSPDDWQIGIAPRGLQFICNNFMGNSYDIYIWANGTVRSLQGNSFTGVDNAFWGTQISSIYSLSSQTISYYCTPLIGSSKYLPYNPTSNIIVNYNYNIDSNPCASTFCLPNGGGGGNQTKSTDSLEQYKSMQQQYDEWLAQLKDNPELLQELLVLSDAMRELSDHAISRILGDSILYLENLKPWYEVVRTPVAKYSLAEVYFYEKKYDQAEMMLNAIPDMFEYSESEMTEHNNYMRFYNFKKQLQLADRNWTQLDETEIAYLQTIAEATNGRSASMVQGVLCFFFDICYEDKIEEGEEGGEVIPPTKNMATETQSSDSQIKDLTYELTLYPNPTSSEMTVALNNPAVKIVEMAVYDIYGKNVSLQTVNQSYSTLKMSELSQGIYILKVRLDQGDVVIRKIVKQ